MSSGRLFYFMRKKPVIAILANYPVWLHCDKIPVRSGHYGVWHVAMHEAFAHNDEFEIHRITLDKSVKKQIDFEHNGEFFHVLPSTRAKVGLFTGYIWNRLTVSRFLKKLKPDLVHAWGTEGCYGLCAMDFKGKTLFSLQGHLTACVKRAKLAWFERIQSLYEKPIFKALPFITTESEWARERILEMVPRATVVLWEYATEERFFSVERHLEEAPCCLLAGTNSPVKNVSLAIKAFSSPELKSIKLYLAGISPDAYPNLPENIIPLGRLNRQDLLEKLSKVWCVVHPSLADSCPNIIKEARVVGVPAVVTHDCGAKQYIINSKSGFIIDSHSESQLINAILSMTKDKQTAQDMGNYDRERCRKALSRQTMVDDISKIYRDILSKV